MSDLPEGEKAPVITEGFGVGSKRLTESIYGWNQVIVSFFAGGMFNGTIIYAYSGLMALMAAELGADAFWQTMPKTAMMLSGAILAPFIGPLVDKHPIKLFLALGAVCFATGLAFVSVTSTILQVTLVFFLFFGPLQSLLGPLTTSALVSRWFVGRRALAIGVSNVGVSAGGFVLPLLIAFLSKTMEWPQIFLVLAGIIVVFILPAILLLTINQPDDFHEQAGNVSGQASVEHTTSTLIRDQGFWTLGICVSIMYGVNVGVVTNTVQIGMELGLTITEGLQAISAMSLAGIVGKILIGYLADKINKCALLALVIILLGIAVFGLAFATTLNHVLICSAITGFSALSSLPLWHSLTASLFGVSNFSRVIGLTQPLVFLMVLAGPPVAGQVKVVTGSYDLALFVFTGMLVAALLLVIGVRAKEKAIEAG